VVVDKLCKVARVSKPHGFDGTLKLHSYMEDISSILGKHVIINDANYKLDSVAGLVSKNPLVKFAGIDSHEKALPLKDQTIYIHRSNLPALSEGEYYWCDLLDCVVHSGEGILGTVIEVRDDGGGLLLKLNNNEYILFDWIESIEQNQIFLKNEI